MTTDPVEFLRRTLAEVKARAEAAAKYPGRRWIAANGTVFDDDGAEPLMSFYNEASEAALAEHVQFWDPAAALRMVAGAEKLLKLHSERHECAFQWPDGTVDSGYYGGEWKPCPTLEIEAERWGWTDE